MKIEIMTMDFARAIAIDAANQRMRYGMRRKWNKADQALATKTLNELIKKFNLK